MRSRRRRGLASRVADACGLRARRCPGLAALMWFRRGFRSRTTAARRGEDATRRAAQRWLFVVSTSGVSRRIAARSYARVARVVRRQAQIRVWLFSCVSLGDFLTFANRPPLPPPPTAVPKTFKIKKIMGKQKQNRPIPSGSACAPATPSGASPPDLGSFSPVQGVVCGAQTDPVRGRSHYRASDGSASSHCVGRRRVGRPRAPPSPDGRATLPPHSSDAARADSSARLHRRSTLASRTRD